MSRTPEAPIYDLALVGAGGANLLVLQALEKNGWLRGHDLLIIEPDTQKGNDRTWSFWTDQTDPAYELYHEVVEHQWIRLSATPKWKIKPLTYRYVQIRSAKLYQHARGVAAHYDRTHWKWESVKKLKPEEDRVELHFQNGGIAQARHVLDSRPPQKSSLEGIVWQSFVGWRVRCPGAKWDPTHAVLMDFDIPQDKQTQFIYFLPNSAEEGLLELTRFSPKVLSEEEALPYLRNYLGKNLPNCYIEEKEINRIPMTMRLKGQKPHPRILPVGGAGGVVKPSTGYAFKNMAKHAKAIVEALESGEELPLYRQAPLYAFCDTLLLRILQDDPSQGSILFKTFFKKSELPVVFRFLDEEAKTTQVLNIMRRMPWRPFLNALWRQITDPRRP